MLSRVPRLPRTWLVALAALLGSSPVGAQPRPPAEAPRANVPTDSYVVALVARTGELLWENRSFAITRASFEMYPDRLIVDSLRWSPEGEIKIRAGVRPSTGTFVDPAGEKLGAPLAVSRTLGPRLVHFTNGWRVSGFDRGFDKTFRFVDSRGNRVWNLHTGSYPDEPVSFRNIIIWNEGRYSGSALVHAQRVGMEDRLWSLDLLTVLEGEALGDLQLHRLGDDVFAQTEAHLAKIEPASGKVTHTWDFRARLGEHTNPGIAGVGSVSRDDSTLVVAFARQGLAIDRNSRELLWHMAPGTLPGSSTVLVYRGVVYLVRGREED